MNGSAVSGIHGAAGNTADNLRRMPYVRRPQQDSRARTPMQAGADSEVESAGISQHTQLVWETTPPHTWNALLLVDGMPWHTSQ